MNVNDLFPSRFLKAHDLGGKSYTLTIRAVSLEDLGFGAEKESKLAIAFEKATKLMLLNRTNAMIIASLYGPETDGWLGKAVTVYAARVKAFGSWHDALRIKEQIPARSVNQPPVTDAMQEAPAIEDENDLLDVDEGQQQPPQDDLWDNSPAADSGIKVKTLSQAQLQRLNILGADLHGKAWDAQRRELVIEVSHGSVTSSKELLPEEAQVIIGMLEKDLKNRAAKQQPVTA